MNRKETSIGNDRKMRTFGLFARPGARRQILILNPWLCSKPIATV